MLPVSHDCLFVIAPPVFFKRDKLSDMDFYIWFYLIRTMISNQIKSNNTNLPYYDTTLHYGCLTPLSALCKLDWWYNGQCPLHECYKVVGSSSGRVIPETIKLVFAKQTTLRNKSKYGLFEWSDMSTRGLLCQSASTIKI